MRTEYILNNGMHATQVENTNCVLELSDGRKMYLTEDMRGGVLGKGFDVAEIKREDTMHFVDYCDYMGASSGKLHDDMADAMTYAVDPSAKISLAEEHVGLPEPDFAALQKDLKTPGYVKMPVQPDFNVYKAIRIEQERTNHNLNSTGERPMELRNNADGFYTIDFFAGTEVGNMSDAQIFAAVQRLQAELKTVSKLGGKAKAVKAHTKRINKNINRLMSAVNSRY